MPPTRASSCSKDDGSGALMRILPLTFYETWRTKKLSFEAAWQLTEAVASVTHGHPRPTLDCFLYLLAARGLLVCEQLRELGQPW